MGKAKATHTNKAKTGIHSLLPISRLGAGRQMLSYLQDSWAPSHVKVIWDDRHQLSKSPPLPSSSPSFILLSMTLYGMGYHFGQLGSTSNFLCTPAYLLVGWFEI